MKKIKAMVKTTESEELYLYGPIGSDKYLDAVSGDEVVSALDELDGADVTVHINSYGGDVFESIAIKSILDDYPGRVDVVVDGIAASGASIIAMAGKTIKVHKGAQMMIHNPWTIAVGNANELRKAADDLDKIGKSIRALYMERFDGSEDDLDMLLNEELFLSAQDCIDYGLADEIVNKQPKKSTTETDDTQLEDKIREIVMEITTPAKEEAPKAVEDKSVNQLYQLFGGQK